MNRFLRYLSVPLVAGVLGLTADLGPLLAAPSPLPARLKQTQETAFERAMRIGYAATSQRDYNTALINFRRALELRPGNPFARVAVQNVEYYIRRDRNAARQRQIDQLEARLAQANEAQDWVCSAATVDELVTYTEPDSLNRERLIGYRGELSGLLESRTNLESWSTVCSPDQPLY
ncbi:MAG: hypothetical protein F6J97_22330 [Leptolyngbya sp. SIO4C1]|nr:hypothetical protein [Leptolyngbya sp. SIO4C1]